MREDAGITAATCTHGDRAAAAGSARSLADAAQVGLLVIQHDRIRYANPVAAAMAGWPVGELAGRSVDVALADDCRSLVQSMVERGLAGKTGRPLQIEYLRRDGSCFDARADARRIDFEGRPAVLLTVQDVSELSRALRRADWHAGMLGRTEALCRSGSFEIALPSGELTLSAGLRALLGLGEAEPVRAHIDALDWIPADAQAGVASRWRSAVAGAPFEFEHRVVCRDGRCLVVLHRGVLGAAPAIDLVPGATASGAAAPRGHAASEQRAGSGRGVAILHDVTAQREAEQRVRQLTLQDEVTGLPNRACLLEQLDAAMRAARAPGRTLALLAFEVPRIDEIRTRMGWSAASALALALAARLRQACGAGEAVARLGDTEFALLIGSPAATAPDALRQRASELQQVLQAPVRLNSTDVFPRCIIGIARFPVDGETPAGLLEVAQTARLDVAGGAGLAFFRAETASRALREVRVEAALHGAIADGEFELHYQPKVDLGSGAVCGAEALLRWQSTELGPIAPVEFIPIAERAGLIGAIGDWVLRRACEQLAAWRAAGLPALRIGVNLSAAQLQRPDLAAHLQALLAETGVDAAQLGIELTEGMLLADVGHAQAVLAGVRSLGIEISLDDFGTGFSSLNSLGHLPIDIVKVDRSFVHDVTAPAQQVSITRAIISMAHGLQMKVLAEGVESEGQLSLLASNGCDQFQGFWFSRPLPADDFAALLHEGKRLPERFLVRPVRTRTLLLVDDEDNIVAALKRLLRRDGYRIVTAASAAEGLQRLAEHEVDVIVSDQRMPGMTGVEFLHRAKALYPQTVRIVLSGYTELQSVIDAVNEGAIYKFLTKPWDDARLREHVAEAFRQKELADENRRLTHEVDAANTDLAALNERLERLLAQQREQAELLAASAAGTRGVLDDLPAAVLGIDPDGIVAYANRAAERALAPNDGLLGRPAAEVLPSAQVGAADANEVELNGQRFQALYGELPGDGNAQGRLVVLFPQPARKAA